MSADGLINVFEIIASYKSLLFIRKWMKDLILYTTYAHICVSNYRLLKVKMLKISTRAH